MNTQNKLQILALITTAGLLTACGASKSGLSSSSDLASRAPVTQISSSSSKPMAYCNESLSSNQTMKLNIMSYSENNQIRNDLMNVKIQAPTNFENDQTFIQMWRWQANSTGSVNLDSVPVQFKLVSIDTGADLTGFMTYVRWSDVSKFASALNVTTGTNLFKHIRMVVDIRDPNAQYDVLKVVSYNTSNSQMIDQMDALMPAFSANPADYAVESDGSARAQVLMNLHPFISKMNQGWTSNDYQTWSNNFCLPFQSVQ